MQFRLSLCAGRKVPDTSHFSHFRPVTYPYVPGGGRGSAGRECRAQESHISLCAGRRDHTYHYVPGEYHNVPGEYHTYHYVPGEYHNVPGEPLRSGRGFLVRGWEAPTKGYSVPTHDLQHAFPSEVVPGESANRRICDPENLQTGESAKHVVLI